MAPTLTTTTPCPWRVLTQRTVSLPTSGVHTHKQTHTHVQNNTRIFTYSLSYAHIQNRRTADFLCRLSASCYNPLRQPRTNPHLLLVSDSTEPLAKKDTSKLDDELLLSQTVKYPPNFLLPPSSTWIFSSSARQGGSRRRKKTKDKAWWCSGLDSTNLKLIIPWR